MRQRWRRWARRSAIGLGTAALLAVASAGVTRWRIVAASSGHSTTVLAAVPSRPVALVLGAGLYPDGSPTPMLRDRVEGAVALYRSGVVGHLLLSGDNGRADHDEPTAMRRLAVAAGVPAHDITLDFAGFDTNDSCARARSVFGVDRAVVVTQGFHMERALYLCRHAGIDAVGYVPAVSPDATGGLGALRVRDWLAGSKAVLETELLHRGPTFDGPFEGLTGSEHPANGE